ncbi:hypothetical protein HMPREF9065_00038 [Aggregatibacter sp. oral taxon 458 str. W10330]|nr:hypothetical protein HMPREF9065_00038 [Aggregatibacter sp. oral taxon 458 str. W10330]
MPAKKQVIYLLIKLNTIFICLRYDDLRISLFSLKNVKIGDKKCA